MKCDPWFFFEWSQLWKMVHELEGTPVSHAETLMTFKRIFTGTKHDHESDKHEFELHDVGPRGVVPPDYFEGL